MGAAATFLGGLREQNQERRALTESNRANLIQKYTTLRDQAQQVLTSGQALDKATGSMRPLTDQEKQQLTDVTSHLSNYIQRLYNPNIDPSSGQLQEDPLHKLATKLRIAKPPQGAPTGETAPEIAKTAAGFQTQFGETPEAAGAQQRQERERNIKQFEDLAKQYNLPEQVKTDILSRMLGAPGAVTRAKWDTLTGTVDGKNVTWLKNQGSGEITDLAGNDIPADVVTRFQMAPRGTPPKVGSLGEFLTAAYGPNPTPAQELEGRRLWAEAAASETVGDHVIQVPQPDGTIKAVVVQTTSKKVFPGAGKPPEAAAPPGTTPPTKTGPKGAGKPTKVGAGAVVPPGQRVKPRGAGVVSIGETVGGKPEKDLLESRANWRGAVDRAKTMHKNLEDIRAAAKEGRTDQQAQLSLLFNHIGMTSGAQKGTRITQTMIDEAQESAPLVARILARIGVGNTLDEMGLRGVVLTDEQMDSMVNLADEKVGILREHVDEAERFARERMEGPAPPETKRPGTGKRVSLEKARSLPQFRGKSDDEIRKAAKNLGYEVY